MLKSIKSLHSLLKESLPNHEEAVKGILEKVRVLELKKGTILLYPGAINKEIYFVEKGLLREFLTDPESGEESTCQIVGGNTFFYSTLSYLTGKPSDRTVEIIEDSRLLTMSKSDIENLCVLYPAIEHFMRKMLEQTLIRAEKRMEIIRIKSAAERLKVFEEKYPWLCNRIPLQMIASYLNITPQTLSRIRKDRWGNSVDK